jgi:hypothetical protein
METEANQLGVYAALSYCWGKANTFVTKVSTLAERKAGFSVHELPKTIRDAVLVARELCIPYIWVDALCIIQDSSSDWVNESARMRAVYENAVVTFAAMDSPNANHGLFSSLHRYSKRFDLKLEGEASAPVFVRNAKSRSRTSCVVHERTPEPYAPGDNTNHDSLKARGWTLQEITLSTRIIWFTECELSWSCLMHRACECDIHGNTWNLVDLFDHSLNSYPLQNVLSVVDISMDWMKFWRHIVQEFSRRGLSVSTDRLPAMSGIAQAFHTRVGGDYLGGIWSVDLANQLLWAHADELWTTTPGPLELPARYVPAEQYAPSWSWTSITRPVAYEGVVPSRRFKWLWTIMDAEFHATGSDQYGPGTGVLTIEGTLLSLSASLNSLLCSPNCAGSQPFLVSEDSILLDPRDSHDGISYLETKHTFVVLAGYYDLGQSKPEKWKFEGLFLENADAKDQTYRRLGHFSSTFENWVTSGNSIWELIGERQIVKLI